MKLMKVSELRTALQERDLPALNQNLLSSLLETTLYFEYSTRSNFVRVNDNIDYFYLGDINPTRDNKHLVLALNTGFVLKDPTLPVVLKKATTLAGLASATPSTQLSKINYELGSITLLEESFSYPYISVDYASGFEQEDDEDGIAPNIMNYGFVYKGIPAWLSSFARLHAMDSFRQFKDWAGDAKQGAMERTRKPSVIAPPDRTFNQMLLEPHIRILPSAVWPISR